MPVITSHQRLLVFMFLRCSLISMLTLTSWIVQSSLSWQNMWKGSGQLPQQWESLFMWLGLHWKFSILRLLPGEANKNGSLFSWWWVILAMQNSNNSHTSCNAWWVPTCAEFIISCYMKPMGAPRLSFPPPRPRPPRGMRGLARCQGWKYEQPGLEMLFLDREAACVCGL